MRTKVCRECTNPYEADDRDYRSTLCPPCHDAKEKRRKQDEQEANAESLRIKNRGIGQKTTGGRPFHLQG